MLNCKILETSASNMKLNNRHVCISFWNIWTNKRHIISLYHCTILKSVEQSLISSQKMPTTSTLMLFCTLRSTALASSCYGCFWNDWVVLAENELIAVPAGFGCSSIMWSTRNSIFCIHKNSHPLFLCCHTGVVPWQVSKWCQHIPSPGDASVTPLCPECSTRPSMNPLAVLDVTNVPPGQDVHYSMNPTTQVTVSMSISCCTSEHARKLHAEYISRVVFCRISLMSAPRNARHSNTTGICGTVSFVCPCLHNKYRFLRPKANSKSMQSSPLHIYLSHPICPILKLSLSLTNSLTKAPLR